MKLATGMKITSDETRNYSSEPWWPAYREFIDMLEELDKEKAPEVGATFDIFEPFESAPRR